MPFRGDLMAGADLDERPNKRRKFGGSQTESATLPTPRASSSEATSEHGTNTADVDELRYGATPRLVSTPPSETAAGQTSPYIQSYRPSVPESSFDGALTIEPLLSEAEAIKRLCTNLQESDEDYRYFELNNFTVFKPQGKMRGLDMVTLDKLQVKTGASANTVFCFDGTLSVGDKSYTVQNVPFSILAVEGYGDEECMDLAGAISIQTPTGADNDIWYRLGKSSAEYRRFHEPYLWVAYFGKLFTDYLLEHANVDLAHFKASFLAWARLRCSESPSFQAWYEKCHLTDFRTTVNANIGYLYKECYAIDDDESHLLQQPIWAEVHYDNLEAIKEQKNLEHDTIVTPFVYNMFSSMYFGKKLKEVRPSATVSEAMALRKRKLCLTPLGTSPTDTPRGFRPIKSKEDLERISCGDVVCTKPDPKSKWKSPSKYWYAYVQDIHTDDQDGCRLDVLYLYEPQDTTLGSAYYPFRNELFLSDNCDCGNGAIQVESVVGTIVVEWFVANPHAASVSNYFVRQKFRTDQENDTNDFEKLGEFDFRCRCDKQMTHWDDCIEAYKLNDTVLVRQPHANQEEFLVPARIVEFVRRARKVRVMKLIHATDVRSTASANELVESLQLLTITPERVVRKCNVEHFETADHVLAPYDRLGAGGNYYILSPRRPAWLNKSPWHRGQNKPPLVGLGLFCGGGNFDRGLEEGGAVKIRYAVDWATHALHSYRANVPNPESVHFFLGSVNDYLSKALRGSQDVEIAKVDDVDMVTGGSPCPGFSLMQIDTQSDTSLRNASMVASVVAHVDLYSPEYLILENVVSMTRGLGTNKNENVFAQIMASLVALGYQVKQFLIDAWSHGSPQQRSRIFIVASTPGVAPWQFPAHTHDHQTDREFRGTALGKATNGLRYGLRRNDVTPYRHISPRKITADLPDVGDSTPQICVRFPDHRTPKAESFASRERIARIPTRPQGMGIEQAVREKAITSGEALEFLGRSSGIRRNVNSRSYSRVYPDGLFGTMLTALHIACGKNGRSLHWEQPRTLTVMEARRAQGFLDHEVIVGTPAQQMKIIGNSVDRKAAFVLGLALREAWLARWDEDEDDGEIDGRPTPTTETAKLTSQALRSRSSDELQAVTLVANTEQHAEHDRVNAVAERQLDSRGISSLESKRKEAAIGFLPDSHVERLAVNARSGLE